MVDSIVLREAIVKPSAMMWRILSAANSETIENAQKRLSSTLIALDPGETTGVAIWFPSEASFILQQWNTKDLMPSFNHLREVLHLNKIKHIRFEDYKVYDHKARDHVNNSLHTAQWIGCIKLCADLQQVPRSEKMAQAAKTFWTDDKLKIIDAYSPGMRHARDALRHLLLLMIFPDRK